MAENTNTEQWALEELGFYLDDRDGVWVVFDDGGEATPANLTERVLWDALKKARASMSLPAAGQEPGAWPKDAAEVREFFKSDFISAQFAAPDHSPCDEDRYYISAHDFLSAINWWADFPHHPSPPEGMVGGWMPIETAPVAGLILLAVEDSAGERRVFPAEASHENGGWVWQVTLGWLGWTRLHSGWTPILWRRLPPPPTSSADSRKGE